MKAFFLVTYLNRDKTRLNGTASLAIITLNASKVGLHAAPMIKVTHMCPAIRPHLQLLITLPDLNHLD